MKRAVVHTAILAITSLCLSGGLIAFAQPPGGAGQGQPQPMQQPAPRPGTSPNMNGPGSAGYNPGPTNTPPQNTPQKVNDKKFLRKAAEGGMAEVALGKLAAEKGSTPAVKQFGEKLVNDHTQANNELKQVAANEKIQIPDSLDAKQQRQVSKLSALSGQKFDKAFLKDQVKDHRKDVREFRNEAQGGSNPAVKQFASKVLPVLEEHLSIAKNLKKSGQ
ncbi:MAG: DUF4142 domain-containing protein [Bryobacteraceae bacterium]